jgi:hypothetical protein
MSKTKWLRLGVRDPADILRWAAAQNARRLDEFRRRLIHGREYVSFRMAPRYAIEIGTSDIIVVAHVRPGRRQRLTVAAHALCRWCLSRAANALAALKPRTAFPAPAQMAELYQLEARRASAPSRVENAR